MIKVKLNLKPKRAISHYAGRATGYTAKKIEAMATEFRKGLKEAKRA